MKTTKEFIEDYCKEKGYTDPAIVPREKWMEMYKNYCFDFLRQNGVILIDHRTVEPKEMPILIKPIHIVHSEEIKIYSGRNFDKEKRQKEQNKLRQRHDNKRK